MFNLGRDAGGIGLGVPLFLHLKKGVYFDERRRRTLSVGLRPEFNSYFHIGTERGISLLPSISATIESTDAQIPRSEKGFHGPMLSGGYAGRYMPIDDDARYEHGWTASAELCSGSMCWGATVYHFPEANDVIFGFSMRAHILEF